MVELVEIPIKGTFTKKWVFSMNGFTIQNNIGKDGEKDFLDYCKKRNLKVKDVSDIKEYQNIDVDFIINGYYTELKTDNLIDKTGNFPIELIHHRKSGDRKGWFFYTQAKYVIRYSKKSNKLYVLYFDKCKDYISNLDKKVKWFDKMDNNYVTGLLLNVKDLCRLGYLRIIDINKEVLQ